MGYRNQNEKKNNKNTSLAIILKSHFLHASFSPWGTLLVLRSFSRFIDIPLGFVVNMNTPNIADSLGLKS